MQAESWTRQLSVPVKMMCWWGAALGVAGMLHRPELPGAWWLLLLTLASLWRSIVDFDLTPAETSVVLCIFTVLFALSYYNFEAGPLPGAERDARTFYLTASAMTWSKWSAGIGTDAYLAVLHAVLSVFGRSLLVAQHFSIAVAAINVYALLGLMRELDIDRPFRGMGLAVFGLIPSFLLHSMLTLREGLMLACFMLGVWAAAAALRRRSAALLGLACLPWLGMGLLHQVMLFFAIALVAVSGGVLVGKTRGGRDMPWASAVTIVVTVAAVGVLLFGPVAVQNDYLDDLSKGVAAAVVEYRNAIDRARPKTAYGFSIPAGPLEDFALGIVRSYWFYLFGPLWRPLRSAPDYVLFAEAGFRLLGIGTMVWGAIRWRSQRQRLALLGLVYLAVTLIWSIGTTNHGQAFRHHMLSNWILVLGSAVACSGFLERRRPGGRNVR